MRLNNPRGYQGGDRLIKMLLLTLIMYKLLFITYLQITDPIFYNIKYLQNFSKLFYSLILVKAIIETPFIKGMYGGRLKCEI